MDGRLGVLFIEASPKVSSRAQRGILSRHPNQGSLASPGMTRLGWRALR
jgi:hypothetical protein